MTPVLTTHRAEELSAIFKAVSDPTRLRLLSAIASSGEMCACDFPEIFDRSQATMSHHLSILVKAGLLAREQRGKWAWFSPDPDMTDVIGKLLNPDGREISKKR